MDFALDEETILIRDSLKRFLEKEVMPLEETYRDVIAGGRISDKVMEIGAEIRKMAVDAGFYTVHMPTELGGGGLSHVAVTALRELVAGAGSKILAVFAIGDPPMGPTPMLMMLDDAQKQKYLEPLMKGEKTTSFCLTEPDAGSNVNEISLSAVRHGSDYVLNGSKIYISNGMHADFHQVFAVTEPGKGMAGGISLFMVDAHLPGLTRSLMPSMGGDDFQAEIHFDDVRVPAEALVGEEGFGFMGAAKWLSGERLMMAIQAVGLAQYALDIGVEWANNRMVSGQPIKVNQGISFPLANCATQIEAARWLTYHTAWLLDQGQPAMTELAMAKVFAADMLCQVADQVLQTLGGLGYMKDHPIERVYRVARVFRIGGGTSETQRRLIAKGIGL